MSFSQRHFFIVIVQCISEKVRDQKEDGLDMSEYIGRTLEEIVQLGKTWRTQDKDRVKWRRNSQ